MAVREIVTVPHPTLRRNARKVTDFGPKLQTLIDDMVETMRVAPGVGLAAPQVDVSLRVIAVEFGDEEDETVEPSLYTVVNPRNRASIQGNSDWNRRLPLHPNAWSAMLSATSP